MVAATRPAATEPRENDLEAALLAARNGDDTGFAEVYRDTQPRLLRYLRSVAGPDAEDVAAETWLQVVRDLTGFTGDIDGFRGWVVTIGRHRALDHHRALARRPVAIADDADLARRAGAGDTEAEALTALATQAAVAEIAALPRDQAEAVLLRVVVGLDVRRAAEVLGKNEGAVRVAAHRGLRRLAIGLRANATPQPALGSRTSRAQEPGAR